MNTQHQVRSGAGSVGGQAPGIDGLTYNDFATSEIARALKVAAEAIGQRRYRPYPTRLVRIPKPSGRYRELRLATIVDRVIAKALQEAITPVLDPIFLPGVFGFRPGRSVWDMLLAIETTAIEQDRLVFAVDDVRDAFPSVPIADAMEDFRHHIGDSDVLWLLEAVLRGSEGQTHTTGVDQGSAVGPVTMNLRLHHALDLPQSQDAATPGNPPWYRWADNLTFLCQGVYEGQSALQRARELLQPAGFTLKGEDGPPSNLKRQGAGVQILGFRVSFGNGRLWYGLGRGDWRDLDQTLERAHKMPDPVQAAKAAVQGWLTAFGPAFESVEACAVLEGVQRVAARNGFRELGKEAELAGWLQGSRQRWLTARGSALRAEGHEGTAGGEGTAMALEEHGGTACGAASPAMALAAAGDSAGRSTGAQMPTDGAQSPVEGTSNSPWAPRTALQAALATRSACQDRPPAAPAGEAGCPGDSSPGRPGSVGSAIPRCDR